MIVDHSLDFSHFRDRIEEGRSFSDMNNFCGDWTARRCGRVNRMRKQGFVELFEVFSEALYAAGPSVDEDKVAVLDVLPHSVFVDSDLFCPFVSEN